MNYRTYQKWCDANGRPVLVAPEGILKIGRRKYAKDGFLYQGSKKIGRYMVTCRFGGADVLVQFNEQGNIHRFEALRWRVLERVKLLNERRLEIIQALKALLGNPQNAETVIRAVGEYEADWRYIDFHLDRDTFSTGCVDVGSFEILDKIATLVRSDEELRLVDRFFRLDALLSKYWGKVRLFESCLATLFAGVHPDHQCPWGQPPIEVTVNGRIYLVPSVSRNMSEIWPTPMRRSYSLDDGAQIVEIKPGAGAQLYGLAPLA